MVEPPSTPSPLRPDSGADESSVDAVSTYFPPVGRGEVFVIPRVLNKVENDRENAMVQMNE